MSSLLPADYEPATVRALVVSASGRWETLTISTSLGAYQHLIGGYVALYRPHKSWHLYCHEATGMAERAPIAENVLATRLALFADPGFAVVVRGTTVVVGTGRLGQDVDVPDQVLGLIADLSDGPTDPKRPNDQTDTSS